MCTVTHILRLEEKPGRGPFSGAENHVMALLPALARQGADVELLAVLFRSGPAIEARLAALEKQGVRLTVFRCNPGRKLRYLGLRNPDHIARLRPLLARRRDRILHLHLDRVIAPVAAWLARCPRVVVSIHADEPWLAAFRRRLWSRWLDRRVARYIAITDHVRAHYSAVSGAPPEKIARIYYGFELPPLTRTWEELRASCGIPPDRFVLGFVGRLAYQKNLPLFLDALRRMPDVHGVIVGDGPLQDELHARVRDQGPSNVQFLGHRPDATDIMAAFDLFCLPSRFEGLGLVLIEAMLRNVGIVGSRAGAIPEILDQGRYGLLFDADDSDDLVRAVEHARRNGAETRERTARALEHAQTAFSLETMARETLRVYRQVSAQADTTQAQSRQT